MRLTHVSVSKLLTKWSSTPDRVNDLRLIHIRSGYGLWTVDRQTYLLKPDDLIILRPGQTRHARMVPRQSVSYRAMRFLMKGKHDRPPSWLMLPPVIHLQGRVLKEFETAILRMKTEREEQGDHYIDLIDALAKQLFISLARYHRQSTTTWVEQSTADLRTEKMPEIDRVIHYIHEHLSEQIEMHSLANLAGMSESHFRRVFSQLTGMSPQKFIIKSRIWRARELLAQGCFYVYEVAQAVGYQDSFYFSRLFRKEVGIPPSVYSTKNRIPIVT